MKKTFYMMFYFLILWMTTLHAEVRVEITQGTDSVHSIGVTSFKWTNTNTILEDISNIIITDLRSSGKFNPLDRSNLENSASKEIKNIDWARLGINFVVSGEVKKNVNGNYHIAYQLIDTSSTLGTVLLKNSYTINKKWFRYAGHAISDEIFEKITGTKGAFRTRIAYVVQTNREPFLYELRISDYDGYNQFVVHRSLKPLMSPSWSPDGSKLAYVTFESGRSSLVIQTLSNGTIRQVASFPCHNGAPAFSPDGTKLAFVLSRSGSLNLYVMDLSSGEIHQVTDERNNNTEPAWFPDSQNLIFTSDQTGHPQIYKVNINNKVIERITWEGIQNQDADISSDGKFIVMVSSSNGQQHIAKQDLLSGRVEILSSTFLDESPSLSPSGNMVIYSSSQGMGTVLNLISTNGRFKTCLSSTDGQIKFPAWSPYL